MDLPHHSKITGDCFVGILQIPPRKDRKWMDFLIHIVGPSRRSA